MPSRHVSRKALTCSGSRVMWSALPSFTSRLVIGLAILHIAAGGRPLEVGVELDAVGRVEVDALDLAAQALAFGQTGHDLEGVTEDHAIRPVLIMLVELGFVRALGDAVEVGEEVGGEQTLVMLALLGGTEQVVDERLGVNLFLDVERGRIDHEIAPVLLVLAPPGELGVEVGVARVADLPRRLHLLLDDGPLFRRRDVLPCGLLMDEGFDGFGGFAGGGWAGHESDL